MIGRTPHLWPVVLAVSLSACLVITVIVGWSIVFPLYYAASFAGASTGSKVGLWVIMGLGEVFLVLVLVALALFLAAVVRRHGLLRRQDTFVDTVTHELRTPLTSLRLSVETLGRLRLDPTAQDEFLRCMRVDIERLQALIEHTIEAGRLEHGERSMRREPVNLPETLESCRRRIQARYELDGDWCSLASAAVTVWSDALAMETMVINLLDNAVKYAKQRPRVAVEATHADDRLRIVVRDEGVGFPMRQRRRLFRRFSRLAVGKQVTGTGLGLYVLAELCRRLGGRVAAYSAGPGTGATFTLELPAPVVERDHGG